MACEGTLGGFKLRKGPNRNKRGTHGVRSLGVWECGVCTGKELGSGPRAASVEIH